MSLAESPSTPTPDSLLWLIWLASPALPIGGFSYSEGLEAAVEWAGVDREEAATRWALDQLPLTLGRSELPVLAQAHRAWATDDREALQRLDDWVAQTRETSEMLQQSRQMGHSLAEWARLHHRDARTAFAGLAPSYPVAFAFAAQRGGASVESTCMAYAFGWSENIVAAAVKAIPLGQAAGQRMLHALALAIPSLVRTATQRDDLASAQAFAPMLAILSSRHESQYSRLFRS